MACAGIPETIDYSDLKLSPKLEVAYQKLKKLEAQIEMAYWKFCVISGSKNPDEDEECFRKVSFRKKVEVLDRMIACARGGDNVSKSTRKF